MILQSHGNSEGFTLAEMAIVILITGLMLDGRRLDHPADHAQGPADRDGPEDGEHRPRP